MLIVDDKIVPEPFTWDLARAYVLDHTELGYTQKSLDRLWHVATVEDGSGGWAFEHPEFIGNVIYLYVDGRTSSYDLWDDAACFTTYRAARAWLDQVVPESHRALWTTVNSGDQTRFERAYFAREIPYNGEGFRPKFRGSDRYFEMHTEIWKRVEDNKRRTGRLDG